MNTIEQLENRRFFLKDTIRQQTDFSVTDQARRLPAPSLQKACSENTIRVNLPDGSAVLKQLAKMSVSEAILNRESVRDYSPEPMTLAQVTALLWATQGVRKVLSPDCALRTVPVNRHAKRPPSVTQNVPPFLFNLSIKFTVYFSTFFPLFFAYVSIR